MVGDAVFLIKIDGRKDFVFRNDKFPGFEHPHNLFDYFQNKAADSFSYWIFSSLQQEKKVPLCEMLEFSGSLSFPIIQFYFGNLR